VRSVALAPASARACPEALSAIAEADLITFGPGSWFTSVLPHLMLPDMAEAITASSASRLVVLNLAAQQGETEGFSPEQHLDVLSAHAPNLRVDSVLADRASVALPQRLASAATRLGAQLDLHDVAVPGTARHDPSKLSVSLAAALERAILHKAVPEEASVDGHRVPALGESLQGESQQWSTGQ
jgi:uncharacterized cofD-like protein